MLRGILAGGFWGGLIGIITLALTSQLADWRDLTPAVTEAETEQDLRPEEPVEAAQEPPVVIAGAVADRPADTTAPASATSEAQGIETPKLETQPPGLPEAADVPATVAAPTEPQQGPPGVAETEAENTTIAGLARTTAPAADTPPRMISTETALTPARLAPEAQSETPVLGAPEASNSAPEVPREMAALDVAPAMGEALVSPTGPEGGVEPPELPARPVPPTPDVTTAAPVVPEADPAPTVPAADDPAPQGAAGVTGTAAPEDAPQSPEIATEPAAEPAPAVVVEEKPAPAVMVEAKPAPVVVVEEEPAPVVIVEAPAADAPQSEETEIAQADTGGSAGDVRIRRLPTIGDRDDGAEESAEPEAEAPVADAAQAQMTALERNASAFDAPAGAARLALVLVHGPEAPAPVATPVPLTFAIPAGLPDAAAVAEAYRAAGQEVVVVPELPDRPTPQDVEVSVSSARQVLDAAVAMGDVSGAGFQGVRGAAGQAVSAAGRSGHGLVTAGRGFNSVERLAADAGVPAFALTTTVSDQVSDPRAMVRALDQAAFRARRDGTAGFLGHATEAQIAAILAWIAEVDDDLVAAPLSAVLLGR